MNDMMFYSERNTTTGSIKDDVLYCYGKKSFVYAKDGDDLIITNAGFNKLYGGKGDDTYHVILNQPHKGPAGFGTINQINELNRNGEENHVVIHAPFLNPYTTFQVSERLYKGEKTILIEDTFYKSQTYFAAGSVKSFEINNGVHARKFLWNPQTRTYVEQFSLAVKPAKNALLSGAKAPTALLQSGHIT